MAFKTPLIIKFIKNMKYKKMVLLTLVNWVNFEATWKALKGDSNLFQKQDFNKFLISSKYFWIIKTFKALKSKSLFNLISSYSKPRQHCSSQFSAQVILKLKSSWLRSS